MTVKLSIRGQRDEGDRRTTRGGPPGAEAPVTDLLDELEVRRFFRPVAIGPRTDWI